MAVIAGIDLAWQGSATLQLLRQGGFVNELTETMISCPYCGEFVEVLINPEDAQQSYIEDCQVCCKPITFVVTEANNGDLSVAVYSENDTY